MKAPSFTIDLKPCYLFWQVSLYLFLCKIPIVPWFWLPAGTLIFMQAICKCRRKCKCATRNEGETPWRYRILRVLIFCCIKLTSLAKNCFIRENVVRGCGGQPRPLQRPHAHPREQPPTQKVTSFYNWIHMHQWRQLNKHNTKPKGKIRGGEWGNHNMANRRLFRVGWPTFSVAFSILNGFSIAVGAFCINCYNEFISRPSKWLRWRLSMSSMWDITGYSWLSTEYYGLCGPWSCSFAIVNWLSQMTVVLTVCFRC